MAKATGASTTAPSRQACIFLHKHNFIHRVLIEFVLSLTKLFTMSLHEKCLRFRDYGIILKQGKQYA